MKRINHLCLVEDNEITVLLTKKILEKTGRVGTVTVYGNGKDAFENLKKRLDSGEKMPELILLDLMMPVWDGWMFLKHFRELDVRDPVAIYIYTSSISKSDYERAEAYGLRDRYLSKPVGVDMFHSLLDAL